MYQEKGRILQHELLSHGIYRLRIASERISGEAKAGQFVLIRVSQDSDPFLRRPFSIHDLSEGSYELVYRIMGRGTEALSRKSVREEVDAIGPLGKGFDVAGKSVAMVAGGMGIAPFVLLARTLSRGNAKATLFYGAKTSSSLVDTSRFKDLGVTVHLATEDGSAGFEGTCTELFSSSLNDSRFDCVCACGPRPMLSAVARTCGERSIRSCQLSVEERMACGVGACLGCSVKSSRGGYFTVCRDGPVFEAGEIEI